MGARSSSKDGSQTASRPEAGSQAGSLKTAGKQAKQRPVGRRRNRTGLIRLIHIGARAKGLIDSNRAADDPERDHLYRALIARVSEDGRTSCKDLSDEELAAVLWHLKRDGFEVRANPKGRYGHRPHNMDLEDLRAKIEALLADMGAHWHYAEAILRRQRGLPRAVACPVSGANAVELRGLAAALEREQHKRLLLVDLDQRLERLGLSREQLAARGSLLKGWERRERDLQAGLALLEQIEIERELSEQVEA